MAQEWKKEKDDENAELRAQLAALAAQVTALTATQAQNGGISGAQLKDVLSELVTAQANAWAAAQREIAERDQRDDVNYPRHSVYAYPEGDKARPRPQLKCRMFWNGFDQDWDVTTASEIEMLNQIEPGIYTFKRVDGRTPETLTVVGERNARGELSKLEFSFPMKENRDTLPSMASMLRDALGLKSPLEQEVDRLKKEIEGLRTAQAVA